MATLGSSTSALSLAQYYGSLLVLQYVGKTKAFATVQTTVTPVVMFQDTAGSMTSLPLAVLNGYNLNPTVQTLTFSGSPASGSFTATYAGSTSTAIAWNASGGSVNAVLASLLGTGTAVVSGSPLGGPIIVTFQTVPVPQVLSATSSLLDGSGSVVTVSVTTNQAVGHQLDILGKYVGVTRSGFGTNGQPITLSDSDFRTLIQIATIQNAASSSLAYIVGQLETFFPGLIRCIDESNTEPMNLSYVVSTAIGTNNLLQLFITEGLLPQPMGVGISVIAPPTTNLFGYCDYSTATPTAPNTTAEPYNNQAGYNSGTTNAGWVYLDYKYSLVT